MLETAETAIVHGMEITVSGSKDTEEWFKRIAQQHAEELKKTAEKEERFKNKIEDANLGPLKPYVMNMFTHGFDWQQLRQYEYMKQ